MRWVIFGKKKVEQRLQLLSDHIQVLSDKFDQYHYDLKINQTTIQDSITELSDKFDRLISELRKMQQITEIPLVKPIIRDAERAAKKEKKEPEAINMWKN